MDILLRFLTQTLRENMTELQLSEMRKRQTQLMLVQLGIKIKDIESLKPEQLDRILLAAC
jgi:hypothetical protein